MSYAAASNALAPVQRSPAGPTDQQIRDMVVTPEQEHAQYKKGASRTQSVSTQLVPQIVQRPELPPSPGGKKAVPVVTRQATYGHPLKTWNLQKVMAPGGWILPSVSLEGQVGVSRGSSSKTIKADTGGGTHKPGAEVQKGDLKVGLSLDPKAFADGLKQKKIGGLTPTVEVGGKMVGMVQPTFGIEGQSVFAKYDFKAQDLEWNGNKVSGQFTLKFVLTYEPDGRVAAGQVALLAAVGLVLAIGSAGLAIPASVAFGLAAA